MKSEVIDRKTNVKYEEKYPKGANFLYNNFLGKIVLKLVTKGFVSKLAGSYMNTKLSTRHIKTFIKSNNIDMTDYKEEEYSSFNAFFSRKIKDGKRQISKAKTTLISPADSKLLVYEIKENNKFRIKGKEYSIKEILRNDTLAKKYAGGYFLVFRLSVDDYHRYSFIDNGKVLKKYQINGKFHTVGPIAFKDHKIFQENQREYELLRTENFGDIIQMEVGALMVGKIVNHDITKFKKGDEKGYFLFGGSTVVIIVEKDRVVIDDDIMKNSEENIETRIKLGDIIGKKSGKNENI